MFDEEVPLSEAVQRLKRCEKTVRRLYRQGVLTGRMQQTIHGRPSKLWITMASIEALLARESRSPLDIARRGLPTGVGR